jgi:hypothetical protein
MQDRLIARDACTVSIGGELAGRVTSGSPGAVFEKKYRHGVRSHGMQSARERKLPSEFARIRRQRASFRCRFISASRAGFSLSVLRLCCAKLKATG